MRFTTPAATLIVLLTATTALAAPLPSHHHRHPHQHHHHAHEHDGQTAPHPHKHHHERPHHRVGLWKWLSEHIHYPHHWPFHPHHHHEQQTPTDRENKQSGSMLRFWLHSHFGPHTSSLRSHRGKPLIEQSQQLFTSSQFDSKPDRHRWGERALLETRGLEDGETPEPNASDPQGDGEVLQEAAKDMHTEITKIHKHTIGKVEKHMKEAMHDAQNHLKEAVGGLHLHLGMAAARQHMPRDLGIEELD